MEEVDVLGLGIPVHVLKSSVLSSISPSIVRVGLATITVARTHKAVELLT